MHDTCPLIFALACLWMVYMQVERGIDLVYGGGSIGLMGLVSHAVHEGGRHVIGFSLSLSHHLLSSYSCSFLFGLFLLPICTHLMHASSSKWQLVSFFQSSEWLVVTSCFLW